MAMKALLRRIGRSETRARRVVLEPRLVDRDTTAPPPDGSG
jgi:DNA-binding LacI/PurR family transcriptional regulator